MSYLDFDPLAKLEELIVSTNNNSHNIGVIINTLNSNAQVINLMTQQIENLGRLVLLQNDRIKDLENR